MWTFNRTPSFTILSLIRLQSYNKTITHNYNNYCQSHALLEEMSSVSNPRTYFNIVLVLHKLPERKYPTDVRSSLFVQTFVACAASTVDPVLLIRLLAHRLVTTPLYPRNSSSITSMSGQEPFPPRTSRSRASSTDTNASTRRKRVRLI